MLNKTPNPGAHPVALELLKSSITTFVDRAEASKPSSKKDATTWNTRTNASGTFICFPQVRFTANAKSWMQIAETKVIQTW